MFLKPFKNSIFSLKINNANLKMPVFKLKMSIFRLKIEKLMLVCLIMKCV